MIRALLVPFVVCWGREASIRAPEGVAADAEAVGYDKELRVFGVSLVGTPSTPYGAVRHAACVMEQYLDQDGDGVADDASVIEALTAKSATIVMGADEKDLDDVEDSANGRSLKAFEDGRSTQSLYAKETLYDEVDASLEEVLHLITEKGYADAYPSRFGEYEGTDLSAAVDSVIGDCERAWTCDDRRRRRVRRDRGEDPEDGDADGEAFCEDSGFKKKSDCTAHACCVWDKGKCWYGEGSCETLPACEDYADGDWIDGSCAGHFHYADATCDAACLMTEGLYWAVMAMHGALNGGIGKRCDDIAHEWELCTESAMRSTPAAAGLAALVDDMGLTWLPNGASCNFSNLNDTPWDDDKDDSMCRDDPTWFYKKKGKKKRCKNVSSRDCLTKKGYLSAKVACPKSCGDGKRDSKTWYYKKSKKKKLSCKWVGKNPKRRCGKRGRASAALGCPATCDTKC